MDTFHPSFVLLADRPLLGAVALAACLAGGTATQTSDGIALAGVPTPIGGASYAPGWQAGAPVAPRAAIADLHTHLAASSEPRLPGPVIHEIAPPHHLAVRPRPIASVPVSPVVTLAPDLPPPVSFASPSIAPATTPAALAPSAPMVAVSNLAPAAPALASTPAIEPDAVGLVGSAPAIAKVKPGAIGQIVAPPAADPEPLKLLSSPELRRFDLAAYRKSAPKAGLAVSRKGTPAASAGAHSADRLVDDVVFHQSAISVAGHSAGTIAVRVGPDMKPSIKVADLIGLVSAQMDPDSLARFSMASSAGEYVSFATLRSAGFDVSYNAGSDSIAISAAQ